MWNLQKARVVQETRIPSPAVYFLLYMWYVSLSKINNGFIVNSFACKKTSNKAKAAKTKC